ncbi:flagellar hook-length control protein FliK [SAR92 clade bacterium H455]|uniref:Flagellar hook-length control protein FliK n=1 Tax=SAR92 clade bacterium H455 TaxID=2974818 RepID=A0ABY5TMV8_9GAMM|nr:flagellar hook-length control protein FliK [SAR92 clade bacterium H455]
MLDSKNILLEMGRATAPAAAGPSGSGQDTAGTNSEQFSALLGDAAASLKAAKSGNSMPLAEAPQKQAAEIDSAAILSSRTLKGGISLIVGGSEPTDAGLIAFARAQGMDPASLGLLTSGTDQPVSSVVLEQSAAANPAISMNSKLNRLLENAEAIHVLAATGEPQHSIPPGSKLVENVPQIGLPEGDTLPLSAKPKLQLATASDKFLTDQQRLQRVQSNQAANPQVADAQAGNPKSVTGPQRLQPAQVAQPAVSPGLPAEEQTLKAAVAAAVGTQATNHKAVNAQVSNPQGYNSQANNPQANNPQANNLQAINPQPMSQNLVQQASITAAKGSLSATTSELNTLDIKSKTPLADVKLSASSAAVKPQVLAGQLEAAKVTIEPKMAEAFLKQHRERQSLPVTKMETINLVDNKLSIATGPQATTIGPLVSAAATPVPLFAEGQVANSTAQVSLNAGLASQAPAEDAMQDALRRQDTYMQLSRQLTDALGKRLTAQIQRGSWHVEMDLHPKSLGRIEVQLEMKNGELEARFIAANATTRDLINEGMPRLREALQEHGTETASMDLGSANQGASDGKSTASEERSEGSNDRLAAELDSDSPEVGQNTSADGLDVHV